MRCPLNGLAMIESLTREGPWDSAVLTRAAVRRWVWRADFHSASKPPTLLCHFALRYLKEKPFSSTTISNAFGDGRTLTIWTPSPPE
jgi:hypothetical protein